LDLFVPYEYGYDFKVIVTNKPLSMKQVIVYHGGRGSQEGVFAELKTHCAMGYVPVRSWLGNQAYLLAGLLAHNLIREFQMQTASPCRKTTPRRAALWAFERLGTFRNTILHRAGRLTRPQGRPTLTVSAAAWLQARFRHLLNAFDHAA
jgi:hypothetical protein